MKALGCLVILLVVLGLCLPSYGEILVYKFTATRTDYEQRDEQWEVRTETFKGYIVIEMNYDDYSITQAVGIRYRTVQGEKLYDQYPQGIELVRISYDGKVQWLIVGKRAELDGEEMATLQFTMLAGGVRNRDVGTPDRQEVASSLSGRALRDELNGEDVDRDIEMTSRIKFTLHPSWTHWANGDGEDEGNQSFEAATQRVKNYLNGKGYTEVPG